MKDSLDKSNVSTEIMYLNVEKDKSEYFSSEKYMSDSTMLEQSKKGIFGMPPNKEMIQDRIIKHIASKKLKYITVVGFDRYTINQTIDFKWNITSDVATILDYKVQKATTDFGGRKWTAWFARDIPINDGPYKFFGLPGLIVKIEDEDHYHTMTLIGVKKLKSGFSYPDIKNYSADVTVSLDNLKTIIKNYRQDPVASEIGKIPDQTDSSGKFRTGEEIIQQMRKIMVEKIKKDNNYLELNLIK